MKEQIDTEFWIHITQSNKQSNIISQSEKYNSLKDIIQSWIFSFIQTYAACQKLKRLENARMIIVITFIT